MGGRFAFLAGFAAGYVLGARAGRERYEQLVKLSQQVVEHPAVQQATRTAGTKAAEISKAAGQKASERMPKVAAAAQSGASKVRDQLDRRPGRHSGHDESAQPNGTRPDE